MRNAVLKSSVIVSLSITVALVTECSLQANQQKCRKEEKRWSTAATEKSRKGYSEFLKTCPKGRYAPEARKALVALIEEGEKAAFDEAISKNTYEAYAGFLRSYSHNTRVLDPSCEDHSCASLYQYGRFEEQAAARMESLRAIYLADLEIQRCSDRSLARNFPSWLVRKDPEQPQQGDHIRVGENGLRLGGYEFINDTPLLEVEFGPGFIVYITGKGIIVGPDGERVLVGYDCQE